MIVSISHPLYLPYIGYFNKIKNSDIFIFLDNAEFTKNNFINRNRIRNKEKEFYLTIPINKEYHNSPINKIIIEDKRWNKQHWKAIENCYSKAPYFKSYEFDLLRIYKYWEEDLFELNKTLIKFLLREFKINTKTETASKYNIKEKATDRLIALVKAVNGDCYLSGMGGKDYLEFNKFKDVRLKWQNFRHPVYKQFQGKFIRYLSAIDLLFNLGEKAGDLI